MLFSRPSSLRRFRDYRRELRERRKRGEIAPVPMHAMHQAPRPYRPRTRSFFALFVQFWAMLRGHRRTLAFVLIALGISTLLGLAPLYGTKIVFDYVLGNHPIPEQIGRWLHLPQDRLTLLTAVAVAMVLLAASSAGISLWSRWQTTRINKRLQVAIRRQVFDHAVRLPLNRVYDLKSGGVASILRDDAGGVADLIFSMLYNPAHAVVQLLGSLFILAWVDWRLLLGSLLLLPTVWLTHRTWVGRIRPLFRDVRLQRQQTDAHATEAFGGMRVVRSFSRQRTESGTFVNNNDLLARQEVMAWWWSRGIDLAWSLLIPLASAILLFYGGRRVLGDIQRINAGQITLEQALTIGDLVMFLSYLVALLGPIATLASSATSLQNSLAGLDRILDLMGEEREMPAHLGAITIGREEVRGGLSIRNVSFAYPPTTNARPAGQRPRANGNGDSASVASPPLMQVLADINLEVRPGEMIALVGPSGAGKTTLCNLIARFYDPTSGAILLDGRDLRDITVETYRRLLGVVEQDTFLFDGTIAQNIAYGRRGATMAQIYEAAQAANAHAFIEKLPQGYNSIIGERGVKLSGGQRQRLTIARAILADPKILILDEATSNLDTESERLIQASLQQLMRGRTSFVIAHRLSTIANADRIVVIEGGRIVEHGRHDELMQRDSRYREMVILQTNPPGPISRPGGHPVAAMGTLPAGK